MRVRGLKPIDSARAARRPTRRVHVRANTRGFRSERDIDELWDGVITRLGEAVKTSLDSQTDPDVFLKTKETILGFITTLEVSI